MTTTPAMSSASRSAADPLARKVVAVASGKGGVGKTWFSISLTHALSRLGQRPLLFDGDLGLANVDIQLGLMPKHDLFGVISGRLTLAQAKTRFEEGAFDIIAGRSGSGSLSSVPASKLTALGADIVHLAAGYDRIVLDLGAGVDRTVRELTACAGTCLVVTTDEPTSLTDAYAFIKLISMERPRSDLRIVVNMVNTRQEGERTYKTLLKACEGFLKISPPLAGIIRRDPKVADSIRHQTPLLTRHPNSEAAQDVEAIARRLME